MAAYSVASGQKIFTPPGSSKNAGGPHRSGSGAFRLRTEKIAIRDVVRRVTDRQRLT